jgi:NAD(P)-dependent dehydrogenase (short-subunit alcohol dehydrogenase family)
MPSVLITGANRGIGLALTRQYAAEGWRVMATCRDPGSATELQEIDGDVDIYALDVTSDESVAQLATSLRGQTIDVLFNNAGINLQKGEPVSAVDFGSWAKTFETNVYAPTRVANAFHDHVAGSERKVMAFTSSRMGSIELGSGPGSMTYRSSKTALNMAVKCMSMELADEGVICVLFHPGHVRTDMGGKAAPVGPDESAAGMRAVIQTLTPEDNGTFRNYDGETLPW